jgi:hypothetical protein
MPNRIVARNETDKVLQELKVSNTDIFDAETRKEFGKLASADVIITGTYRVENNGLVINIQAIDIETGTGFVSHKVDIRKSAVPDNIWAQLTNEKATSKQTSTKAKPKQEMTQNNGQPSFTFIRLSFWDKYGFPPIENVYGIDFGFGSQAEKLRGLQANLFYNEAEDVVGIQVTIFINKTKYMKGIQIAPDVIMPIFRLLFMADDGNSRLKKDAPIQTWVNNDVENMTGIQIGTLNSVNNMNIGIQIGWGYNEVIKINGIQIGLVNYAETISGIQISAVNLTEITSGIQIGGAVNLVRIMSGIQISGLTNLAETISGVQIGGAANLAKTMSGIQIGFVNYAETISGIQIGLVNYAAQMKGIQIGLINTMKNASMPYMILLNWNL